MRRVVREGRNGAENFIKYLSQSGVYAAFHSFSSLANELNKLYTCWRFGGIKYREMDRREERNRKDSSPSFLFSSPPVLLTFFATFLLHGQGYVYRDVRSLSASSPQSLWSWWWGFSHRYKSFMHFFTFPPPRSFLTARLWDDLSSDEADICRVSEM